MVSSRIALFALWRCVVLLLTFFSGQSMANAPNGYVTAYDPEGNKVYVPDNRRPSLYTQSFGDCQGDSLINVTRFDGAYYRDNMTVTFNLEGHTSIENDTVMLYIGVFAYGESRFDFTFNPCSANINSLCPMNASVPIQAKGMIQVSQQDVSGIPAIAMTIPDFEGQAILRIFSNSTQSQIGCFSSVLTNGASFAQPTEVASILGGFTVIAVISSLAVAIYGSDVSSNRSHYAHSLSVFVVFSVFHHIYFTGALSMNWPSVLVAFWSNYAWSAGFIYTEKMQNSINQFLGSNKGNISIVGAAASGTTVSNVGGGYDISKLYKREVVDILNDGSQVDGPSVLRRFENTLAKRADLNALSAYPWHGSPVKPGLPLPGNYSGFAGTLAEQEIPASNAFMTGLIWFLVLLGGVAASIVILKLIIEMLALVKLVTSLRFSYFRAHWLRFVVSGSLRTFFIAFYMMIFLTLFQFTFGGSAGVTAIAAVVFAVFVISMLGAAGYALYYRLRAGRIVSEPDRLLFKREKLLFCLPWFSIHRESQLDENTESTFVGSLPWWRIHYVESEEHTPVHEDEDYLKKFGWLSARFRRRRWWSFAIWLIYEFVRACFFGGAAGHPMTQVFGILAVEFIALIAIIWMRPFESTRLNALMVYFLGFSKVSTVALSAAFDPRFNLNRITTTIIGIVIIIIQGVLTCFLLLFIVIGAISSYMSVTRHKKVEEFRPRSWRGTRTKYLAHVEKAASDLPPPPPPPPPPPESPKGPSFNVNAVQRYPKIEDEDPDNIQFRTLNASGTLVSSGDRSIPSRTHNRPTSLHSHAGHPSLPFGARPVRASWSGRDFEVWDAEQRSRFSSWADESTAADSQSLRHSTMSLRDGSLLQAGKAMSRAESPARAPSRASTVMTGRSTPAFFRTHNSLLWGVEEDAMSEESSSKADLTESPCEVSTQTSNEVPTGTSNQADATERTSLHETPTREALQATKEESTETAKEAID